MRREITNRLVVVVILSGLFCASAPAQTAPDPPPVTKETTQRKIRPTQRVGRIRVPPVFVQNGTTAPQVVTILHGLNGLKVFRLLLRSNQLAAIAKIDEAFQIQDEIHTNVIAGLALNDGRTIAVWLPEAGAEMLPAFPYAPEEPSHPRTQPSARTPASAAQAPEDAPLLPGNPMPVAGVPSVAGLPSVGFETMLPADLKVITREGKKLLARYVGLDGLTGLSVITLANNSLPPLGDSKDEVVNLGQRVRLIGPQRASQSAPNARAATYVRIGETEATVVSVSHTPAGGIRSVRIKSAKLTPANAGGIALNEAGETLGIVDAVVGNEATIVPLSVVRSAVKRVVDRQASVPRPWLGIQGEPIGALSWERILSGGWQAERARSLADKRRGIMLTSVVPGSPAAEARLRPGDVILSVNNDEVRDAEDFTWLLNGATPGHSLTFTIARPEKLVSEAMEIKLSESPDLEFGFRIFGNTPKSVKLGSLMALGIETIALKPEAATHFGSSGGLFVVYVDPSTPAFKAGLQPGDVIESVNGQQLLSRPVPKTLLTSAAGPVAFSVVRNKQKIVITIQTK